MEVETKKINNYDLYIHRTKKYPTIRFALFFELPYTKKNIYMCDLLDEYMLYNSKQYNTRKKVHDKSLELYSLGFSIHNVNVGDKLFIEVQYRFYDPDLVGEDYLDHAFEFARDMLELNADNVKLLNPSELEFARESILSYMGRTLMNNNYRAGSSYKKCGLANTYVTEDLLENKEELDNLLNSFTDKDLIDLYDKIFKQSFIGAFLMGNIKNEYLHLIEKYFKFEQVIKLDKNYNRDLKFNMKETYIKVQDNDYKESILRLALYAPSTSYKEKMTYNIINRMLGFDGLLLHKVLRDKYKLVYHTESRYNKYADVITLVAYIDKETEKKTLDAMDEVITMLKDETLVGELLKKVKESIDISVYTQDENPNAMFNELITNEFDFDVSTEEFHKVINSIEVNDIMCSLNKIEKLGVHFYEGVKK